MPGDVSGLTDSRARFAGEMSFDQSDPPPNECLDLRTRAVATEQPQNKARDRSLRHPALIIMVRVRVSVRKSRGKFRPP